MLFWLFILLLIIAIIVIYIGSRTCDDVLLFIGWIFAGIFMIAIGTSIGIIIQNNISAKKEVNVKRERYEALCYKLESGACRDEFGLLSKEVIDEIQQWNEELVEKQTYQKDFWLGIYYPNIYDEFEIIEYTKYKK